MATLNQQETKDLDAVRTLLSVLAEDTRKPPGEREWFATLSPERVRMLQDAKSKVHTVIVMKGHYPK